MSKIFKSAAVTVDGANRFFIDTTNPALTPGTTPSEESPAAENPQTGAESAETKEDPAAAAAREADLIRKKAREDAEKIVAEATAQARKKQAEAAELGRKEGYDAGYKKGADAAESLKKEAADVLADATAKREETLAEIEPQMVELILKITGKLLYDSAEIHPKTVLNLIKQGIVASTITGDIIIRVSAEDYSAVDAGKADILSLLGGNVHVDIIKDFSLKKLDCVIETPFGNIDCGLDQKYEALKSNLYYILENR
ncbi:MAG: hypothetical protein LBU77_06085 [Clostridiales bacterium]|nr:hypothetical protein [Clostridiales bacterium]